MPQFGYAVLAIAALLILAGLVRADFTKRNLAILVVGAILIVLVVLYPDEVIRLTRLVLHLLHVPF